jgi:hypothetical protein
MIKIEAGHYRGEGFEVFRCRETLYTGHALARPNRWGNMSTASSRVMISWSFKVGSEVVNGFGSKRQAVESARRFLTH